jgi:hypothetical protein
MFARTEPFIECDRHFTTTNFVEGCVEIMLVVRGFIMTKRSRSWKEGSYLPARGVSDDAIGIHEKQ